MAKKRTAEDVISISIQVKLTICSDHRHILSTSCLMQLDEYMPRIVDISKALVER